MDTLTVLMQDLLTQNHALRRENEELMDQVRRLLCEKANLLAQVWPPACPVEFPATFKAMQPLAGNLIEIERTTQDHAPAT
ncbi:protein LDOC1-like isoform 2-T2 [Glossophaga mutica]